MGLIEKSFLVDGFVRLLGPKGAENLVGEALVELGLPRASAYSDQQIRMILEHLKLKGGAIQVFATGLITHLNLQQISRA
jgi:hypothetical protein